MANFTREDLSVKTEQGQSTAPTEPRVVKHEGPVTREVQAFDLPKLNASGRGSYAATKARFGALAATDADRPVRGRQNSRFSLNQLQRDPLAIEAEEQRIIEERVRGRVSAIAEEARSKAAQDGYRDGLAKGHEEAFIKFREEAAGRIERLEGLIGAMEGAKTEIFRANERFIMETIYHVSKMLLLRELTTDRDFVLRLARDLVQRLGLRDNIRVRIHPDEAASVGMLKEGLEKSFGTLQNLTVEASPEITHGGCHVETEWNAIDASIETQLKGIHDALIGAAPDSGAGG